MARSFKCDKCYKDLDEEDSESYVVAVMDDQEYDFCPECYLAWETSKAKWEQEIKRQRVARFKEWLK